MIDLNQELEDFDAYFFKRHGELPLDPSSEEYANKSYLKHEMFKAWKARAKAQAVPEDWVSSPRIAFGYGFKDCKRANYRTATIKGPYFE